MKTALCISGHLRTFNYTYSSILENIIEPLNCDVFIHTWNVLGAPTGKNIGDINKQNDKTLNYLDLIDKTYAPKLISIENGTSKLTEFIKETSDIKVPSDEQQYVMTHIGLHISMFYSLFAANNLKKEYENITGKYDLVIRLRPDLHFYEKLTFDRFEDKNSIYVPEIATYTNDGLNDQVAIGSSELMDKYCDIYNEVQNYYRHHKCTARPESMIKYHLDNNKINYIKSDIKYDMWRLDGSVLRQQSMHAEFLPNINILNNHGN